MDDLKKIYNKAFPCFVLAFLFVFLQAEVNVNAASYEIGGEVIVDGFIPSKNTTIIHYLNTAEKPYTKIANAVEELWVGDHHRFTVVANNRESVKIRWYSSNPEIASIKKTTGELTALAAGETTITMWDSVNQKKHKVTLTVKAVPVLPEIPREWYTIAEKPDWVSSEGIQLVLKTEYRYLYEQCSMLCIPESIDGQNVVYVCTEEQFENPTHRYESADFKKLKMLECQAAPGFFVDMSFFDEHIYPEGTQWITDCYKKIHIPESAELILSDGLCQPELQEVRIPSGIKLICRDVFWEDNWGVWRGENVRFIVDGNNTNYYSISDVLFSYPYDREGGSNGWIELDDPYNYGMEAGKYALLAYPKKKAGEVYYVPDGIERIEAKAFEDAQYLKKIVLPDSVTEIGEMAFDLPRNKRVEITIPASVIRFEDNGYGGPFGMVDKGDANILIITSKGSAAEAYAIENGIEYRIE